MSMTNALLCLFLSIQALWVYPGHMGLGGRTVEDALVGPQGMFARGQELPGP